ncbi:MAG: hypothetical protein ABI779_00330 [Acidobacteriota bacterium]
MCVLVFPTDLVEELRAALPFVLISREGESLHGCDLVVIDDRHEDTTDLAAWFATYMPRFPLLIWNGARSSPDQLLKSCRDVLFSGRFLTM